MSSVGKRLRHPSSRDVDSFHIDEARKELTEERNRVLKGFTHDQRLLQGRPRPSAGGDEALYVQHFDHNIITHLSLQRADERPRGTRG